MKKVIEHLSPEISLNFLKSWRLGHWYVLLLFTCSVQFSSVQSLSRVRLFATPWTAARQVSLSITNSLSLLKLMSVLW